MSTPNSTISVCSGVRLTPDYTHTIWFDSPVAQWSYFVSKVAAPTFMQYTYLRKSWSMKLPATMEQARTWNYLFFNNDGKNWYYFITNIEYINDNTVELFLEMDVMQSYMFDYQLLDCFVEREHAALDPIGSNVVDEGLDVGEYITIADKSVDLNDYNIMILATSQPGIAADTEGELVPALGAKYDNVFSGLGVYCISLSNAEQLQTILNKLDNKGTSDVIVSMWMYPGELLKLGSTVNNITTVEGIKKDGNAVKESWSRNSILAEGYEPRNNKLFCYPYNFLYVTNNYGDAAVYHYERFGNPGTVEFVVVGSVSPDGSVRMYPLNYAGMAQNYETGITLGNFPTCAWDSDVFKMWLAQTQATRNVTMAGHVIQAAGGLVTAAAGLATGNAVSMGAGAVTVYQGAMGIAEMLAQIKDRSIQPDEARGTYSSTVNMAAGFQTFTLQKKCITKDQAQRLDSYFDMYGYKTLAVKKPNRHCRERWTYTKTLGCQIAGNLCTDDKVKIQSIYDKGITFWKNGDEVGDYSQSNKCTGEV